MVNSPEAARLTIDPHALSGGAAEFLTKQVWDCTLVRIAVDFESF
jgi:hypothetical protein